MYVAPESNVLYALAAVAETSTTTAAPFVPSDDLPDDIWADE